MTPEEESRFKQLCYEASVELDPGRLLELVQEINTILAAKQKRIDDLRRGQKAGAED